jgi:hypothetical protein
MFQASETVRRDRASASEHHPPGEIQSAGKKIDHVLLEESIRFNQKVKRSRLARDALADIGVALPASHRRLV